MSDVVTTPIEVTAEIQQYVLTGDDIFVKEFTNENIPVWYTNLINNVIHNSPDITTVNQAIALINTLTDGYTQQFANILLDNTNLHSSLTSLTSTVGSNSAAIAALNTSKVDATSAQAIAENAVIAHFNNSGQAWFDSKISTYASDIETNAIDISNLSSTLGDSLTSTINTLNSVSTTASSALTSANTAVTTANAAQTTANTASTNATNALNQLTNIASDNVLSPVEKTSVISAYAVITTEQSGIDTQATNFSITTEKTAYDTAVTTLSTYLATLTIPVLWNNISGDTTIVGTTFRTKFNDVYTTRQTLLNAIYTKAKALADAAQSTANTGITNAATAQALAISTANSLTTLNSTVGNISASVTNLSSTVVSATNPVTTSGNAPISPVYGDIWKEPNSVITIDDFNANSSQVNYSFGDGYMYKLYNGSSWDFINAQFIGSITDGQLINTLSSTASTFASVTLPNGTKAISGWQAVAGYNSGGLFSDFIIVAGNFKVADTLGSVPVFTINTTNRKATFTSDVEINGNLLISDTITAAHIQTDAISDKHISVDAITGKNITGGNIKGVSIEGASIHGAIIQASYFDLMSVGYLTNWEYFTPAMPPDPAYNAAFARDSTGALVVHNGYYRLIKQKYAAFTSIAQSYTKTAYGVLSIPNYSYNMRAYNNYVTFDGNKPAAQLPVYTVNNSLIATVDWVYDQHDNYITLNIGSSNLTVQAHSAANGRPGLFSIILNGTYIYNNINLPALNTKYTYVVGTVSIDVTITKNSATTGGAFTLSFTNTTITLDDTSNSSTEPIWLSGLQISSGHTSETSKMILPALTFTEQYTF